MFKKYKISIRLISCALSAALVFNPYLVPVVWAEGEASAEGQTSSEPTSTPVPEQSQSTPTDQGSQPPADPTTTPTPSGNSTTVTGDAQASSDVQTTANVNQVCLPGQVSDPANPCTPPAVQTEPSNCDPVTSLANDNTATISGEATASARTGANQITNGSGDASLLTGDATASGDINNQINSNTVLIDGSSSGNGSEPTGQPNSDTNPSGLVVDNQNNAEVTNQENITAETGQNQTNDNLGSATMVTGKAMALANLLNYINSNLVGSSFEIMLLDNLEGQTDGINLNEIWKEVLSQNGEDWQLVEKGGHFFLVKNQNQADLVNNVVVSADSGSNQANNNGNGAAIQTGDATALANLINLINLNLLGSNFFLGVINLLGDFNGDLILPRPEMFTTADSTGTTPAGGTSPATFQNDNQAQVQDSVTTQADSGSNQAVNNTGDNSMTTGEANSQANSQVVANTNILNNNWFFLVINYLGNWFGKIFNWSVPGAVQEPGNGQSLTFQISSPGQTNPEPTGTADSLDGNGTTAGAMLNQNQAEVQNNLTVNAVTGNNQANNNQGGTNIQTGKATALANLFDLINLNVWGSHWFMGIVNILGNWTGNVIFAYPDVAVELTNGGGEAIAGQITHYTVNYKNQGYDEANNVWAKIELPPGVSYLSDNSGLTSQCDGSACSWFLGNLKTGQLGSFQIEVQVSPEKPTANNSFINRWLAQISSAVRAEGEDSWTIVAVAKISTETPESNLTNNTASAKTIVYPQPVNNDNNDDSGVDQRQPKLEISAWNNVHDFVYPGDTVTFEITIKNTSDIEARDAYVVQELADGVPYKDYGAAGFDLGTIEPGKQVVLSFGLKLANDGVLPAGFYHTTAIAYAYAPNGEEVVSNQAKTNFRIQWKEISAVLEAKAVGKEDEVLGAACLPTKEKEDLTPYILALLVSSLWLVDRSRKRFNFTDGLKKS